MNLASQCCAYVQAMKLYQFDIKQEARFYHVKNILNQSIVYIGELKQRGNEIYCEKEHESFLVEQMYAAFNVAELHAMIPETIYLKGSTDWINWYSFKRDRGRVDVVVYKNGDFKKDHHKNSECFGYPSFAKSLAELLLWMLKEKIVSPKEINKLISKNETAGHR